MKTLYKPFLPALAIFGLMLGCGGDEDSKEESGDGSGAQGGGEKATDLAKFLPGKRISFTVVNPEAPPKFRETTMLVQFELDGTFTVGTVDDGKAVAIPGPVEKLSFKVDGLKVTMPDPFSKGESSMTFSSANPKVGDKFTIREPGDSQGEEITISAIEKAGKLEMMALPANPGPGEPEPEGIGGGPAFGMGPNGEFAKSKHPAFIAHTWKTDPFSRGTKHSATFGKEGVLTITPEKGKPLKGTWEVAGPRITLAYPDPETGKEKALEYRFLFGGGESEGADGKTIEIESLILKGAGNNKSSIVYERPLPTGEENPKK